MIAPNEQIAGGSARKEISLADIERRCGTYDLESAKLEEMIAALESDLDAVKQKHLAALKRQAGVVANIEADLNSTVERAPGLFTKPKTIVVHGVKVGFSFSNGRLVWDCEDETMVMAIKRVFGRSAADYLHTKEVPNKDALRTAPAEDLKRLPCRIDGAGDQVIVKRVAGDVEKLINKLIEKLVEAMVTE